MNSKIVLKGNGADTLDKLFSDQLIEKPDGILNKSNSHTDKAIIYEHSELENFKIEFQRHLTLLKISQEKILLNMEEIIIPDFFVPQNINEPVHQEIIYKAERISKIINESFCEIEYTSENPGLSPEKISGKITEIRSNPSLINYKISGNNTDRIGLKLLETHNAGWKNTNIPIIGIAGKIGKTSTGRLIGYILSRAGYNTGISISDGIYHNNFLIKRERTLNANTIGLILEDPSIDAAVLECYSNTIKNEGLGFNNLQIGIITNFKNKEENKPQNGKTASEINALIEAEIVVGKSVSKNGYAIINADDPYSEFAINLLETNTALFSKYEDNPLLQVKLRSGGVIAYFNQIEELILMADNLKINFGSLKQMPLWQQNNNEFIKENILSSTLTAFLIKIEFHIIYKSLQEYNFESSQLKAKMIEENENKVLEFYGQVLKT